MALGHSVAALDRALLLLQCFSSLWGMCVVSEDSRPSGSLAGACILQPEHCSRALWYICHAHKPGDKCCQFPVRLVAWVAFIQLSDQCVSEQDAYAKGSPLQEFTLWHGNRRVQQGLPLIPIMLSQPTETWNLSDSSVCFYQTRLLFQHHGQHQSCPPPPFLAFIMRSVIPHFLHPFICSGLLL